MKALLFSDEPKNLKEIITYFSNEMEVTAISPEDDSVKKYGAKKVYFYKDGFSDNISNAIKKLNDTVKPDYIFISSTILGREIAGIVSSKLNEPCISEIFAFKPGKMATTKRFFYGGKTVLEEESNCKLFTVSPGLTEAKEISNESESENLTLESTNYRLIDRKEKKMGDSDIAEAKIIVSIGRGIGSKENIDKIMPLVDALHAKLAGSRPICLDYKWLSEDQQIGLSGKKVRPDIYIALGISGQIQHIAGIRGAKTIVAINKDKSAPIFEECDYGIVGDLFKIVSALVNKINN